MKDIIGGIVDKASTNRLLRQKKKRSQMPKYVRQNAQKVHSHGKHLKSLYSYTSEEHHTAASQRVHH